LVAFVVYAALGGVFFALGVAGMTRIGGLLAIAVLPLVAGLGGEAHSNPTLLEPAYRTAMWACASLLAALGVLAVVFVRRPGPNRRPLRCHV
jgi:hypothetical protein